jgi:hypothetical protein
MVRGMSSCGVLGDGLLRESRQQPAALSHLETNPMSALLQRCNARSPHIHVANSSLALKVLSCSRSLIFTSYPNFYFYFSNLLLVLGITYLTGEPRTRASRALLLRLHYNTTPLQMPP